MANRAPAAKEFAMAAELCTEQEVIDLVHAFYARVRRDEVLGPIFNTHIDDWDQHLAKLVDFWSAILRRTARFSKARSGAGRGVESAAGMPPPCRFPWRAKIASN